jgi:16S rRNA (adenine1518-N6/adenine1519-N6)-dimethyltransferase
MTLTSPKTIKEIFEKNNIKPNKILGQNFLIDKNILDKIIKASDLKPTDIVLEVGPGIGTLTQELAKKTKKVFSVEKDQLMLSVLKETLKDYKNIKLINQDILKFEISDLFKNSKIKNYKIISNIPYYLTSPLIRKFLESENQPKEIILMIQKEVAQRICSNPPKMSLLSVSVQFYAEPKIISYVSKNCFWPAPKIDSAIIKITPFGSKPSLDPNLFFKIVKAGFSQPRKQIAGNLSKNLKLPKTQIDNWLIKNNIKPNQRAETLYIEDWKNLTKTL